MRARHLDVGYGTLTKHKLLPLVVSVFVRAVNRDYRGTVRRKTQNERKRRADSPAVIAIGRRHIRRDAWEDVVHTLLHEMVHQWQQETGLPVAHDRSFRTKAREVGIDPRAVLKEPISG